MDSKWWVFVWGILLSSFRSEIVVKTPVRHPSQKPLKGYWFNWGRGGGYREMKILRMRRDAVRNLSYLVCLYQRFLGNAKHFNKHFFQNF